MPAIDTEARFATTHWLLQLHRLTPIIDSGNENRYILT